MSVSDFLNSTAIVQKFIEHKTGMGGAAKQPTPRITALPCRLSKKRISETDEFGKMTLREVYVLYCDASETNRAIIESDRIDVLGRTFEIKGIYNPGDLNRHLEIGIEEVR